MGVGQRSCSIIAHVIHDAEELGRRLAAARQEAGKTQEDLASAVGIDRSSLAKIETGKRRVSALELARIADAVDKRVEWFLDEAPPAVISRRNSAAPGEPSPIIDRVAERLIRDVEFIQELGAVRDLPATPNLRLPTTMREAEEFAEQCRRLLGYADSEPATDLSRHAAGVGLLAFSLPLGEEAADGASVLLRQGGVAVINGSRHLGRRRLTLAHELAHFFIADEFSVDWRVADELSGQRESRIDRFARALLLPQGLLADVWAGHRDGSGDLRTTAVLTGSVFRVDMATLARRLQETGLISGNEVGQVRSARTTRADIVEFDLLIPEELSPIELPRIYEEAVLRVYRSEQVSCARTLELLLDSWQETDLPDLATLPEQAIWKFVS
jgi:transcriptional regulator with XRE-family HTH domain/Zn-dependent peptidase ImmA (M78 family)